MARPSLLTDAQCAKAREMRTANPKRWSAIKLAKHFGVSESSMYTVLNGTYTARHAAKKAAIAQVALPVAVAPALPPTQSLFHREQRVEELDFANLGEPSDLEVAAAQLVLAKSRFLRAARELQHS